MIKTETIWRLNAKEVDKRNYLLSERQAKINGLNHCRIILLDCKQQATYLNARIRYCKSHLPHDKAIFDPMRTEIWESPNLWDLGKDFSLGAKAYAYLLYYRQQMRGIQKIIKSLKAELTYRNETMTKTQKELIAFDKELEEKYKPIWKPCKFVLKRGDIILGEKDMNPNLEIKRFRYFDTILQFMHHYDENDIERFED